MLKHNLPPDCTTTDYNLPETELAEFYPRMSAPQPAAMAADEPQAAINGPTVTASAADPSTAKQTVVAEAAEVEGPDNPKIPGLGHNQEPANHTFQDDVDAIVAIGTVITSFRRIGLAIHDPRCQKRHLRVLYNFMERLNGTKGTAFPDRRTVADDDDLEFHTVENVLYELRSWGHIDWEKRADPRHEGRLLHYTLPVRRWPEERLKEEITKAVLKLRSQSTRPARYSNKVPGPSGTSPQSTRPAAEKSTRPAVCSNLLKEPEEKGATSASPLVDAKPHPEATLGMPHFAPSSTDRPSPTPGVRPRGYARTGKPVRGAAAGAGATCSRGRHDPFNLNPEAKARTEYAAAQVQVSVSGKVTIGPEFHAELLRDGFIDPDIEQGLLQAPKYTGSNPEANLKAVRTACAWAKEKRLKSAAFKPKFAGRSNRPSL